MFTKAIKQTAYAILATATMSIGSAGLTSSAQAAPINLNHIQISQAEADNNFVEVRGGHHFKGHQRGFRKFSSGHRSGFKRHGKHFKRSHFNRGHGKRFRSNKFSRHGGFKSGHAYRYSRNGRTK